MSPSLNSLCTRFRPRPKTGIGLALGRDRICAVRVTACNGAWSIVSMHEAPVALKLFNGSPDTDAADTLSAALDVICAETRGIFEPLQIALPDPAVSLQVFDLETLPGTKDEQKALACWRFEKALSRQRGGIECSCQYLGEDGGRHLLLSLAIDRAWLACLTEACRKSEIVPTVIDMAAMYHFNRFHDSLKLAESECAIIVLEPFSWTLMLCDSHGRLRFSRSRWRPGEGNANIGSEHESIVLESERLIRAYAHGASGRRIRRVIVTGTESDMARITDQLNRRMQTPCDCLPLGYGVTPGDGCSEIPPGIFGAAVAAAVPR